MIPRIKGSAAVAAAMIVLVLAGCLSHDEDPLKEGRVQVEYWEEWTDFEFRAIEDIVNRFNRSQDEIYVNILNVSQLDRKLLIATAGNNPPDVANIQSQFVPQLADKDALEPLDPLLPVLDVKREQYIDIYWDVGCHKGNLYGLPSTPWCLALHWNKAAFREAGLDPDTPPGTLEELDIMAEKLTRWREDGSFETLGFVQTQPGWFHYAWPFWFGGRWCDQNGNITANCVENVAAFEWIRQYSDKYGGGAVLNFSSGFGNSQSSEDGFFSNKIAMVQQGTWLANFIDMFRPDMDWGAAPLPSPGGKLKDVTLVETNLFAIPRGARHKEAAAKFIGFTQLPENHEYLSVKHTKFMPLRIANELDYSDHPNKEIELFIRLSQSPNAHSIPRTPLWSEYESEIIYAFEQVWLGQATPQAALDSVQRRMEEKWRKYCEIQEAIEKVRKGS